jgi:hypothetical protein
VLDGDPIDYDGVVSKLSTMIMPSLECSSDELGVLVHIDDCFCTNCEEKRGSVEFASTVLLEVTNAKSTMIARLLPGEAESLALELIKHSAELRLLIQQGWPGNVK